VFSVTKGITAGMVHWLVDNGYVVRCYGNWVWLPLDFCCNLFIWKIRAHLLSTFHVFFFTSINKHNRIWIKYFPHHFSFKFLKIELAFSEFLKIPKYCFHCF
jgi:hypothetical protein